MKNVMLTVASDFTRTPGVRSTREGDFSGEDFLVGYLYPRFTEAVRQNVLLVVNLDGTAGYATSFLEASFGGLIRGDRTNSIPSSNLSLVKKHLQLIATDDPYLIEEINEYMLDASEAAFA